MTRLAERRLGAHKNGPVLTAGGLRRPSGHIEYFFRPDRDAATASDHSRKRGANGPDNRAFRLGMIPPSLLQAGA
jgi:hypothetical protein